MRPTFVITMRDIFALALFTASMIIFALPLILAIAQHAAEYLKSIFTGKNKK